MKDTDYGGSELDIQATLVVNTDSPEYMQQQQVNRNNITNVNIGTVL